MVAVPAGQVERSPAVLALLRDVDPCRHEHSGDLQVAVQGSTVGSVGASLRDYNKFIII